MSQKTTTVKMGGVTGANEFEVQFISFDGDTVSIAVETGAARIFANTTARELLALSAAAHAAASVAMQSEGATA